MAPEPLNYAGADNRRRRRFPFWAELTVLTILLIVFAWLGYVLLFLLDIARNGLWN